MAKTNEKNLARELFLNSNFTLAEIADKVNTSAKTVGKWKEEENWDRLKSAKHATRQEIISMQYELLKNVVIKNKEKQGKGELTASDIDAQSKLSASIKALSDEESLSGYIQAFTPYLNWLRTENPTLAKQVAESTEAFLLKKANEL